MYIKSLIITLILAIIPHRSFSMELPEKQATQRLFEAIDNKSLSGVQEALRNGADPNAQNEEGVTALNSAIDANSAEIFNILLENGADPTGADRGSPIRTPLFKAAKYNKIAFLLLLNSYLKNYNESELTSAITAAISNRSVEAVRALITENVPAPQLSLFIPLFQHQTEKMDKDVGDLIMLLAPYAKKLDFKFLKKNKASLHLTDDDLLLLQWNMLEPDARIDLIKSRIYALT